MPHGTPGHSRALNQAATRAVGSGMRHRASLAVTASIAVLLVAGCTIATPPTSPADADATDAAGAATPRPTPDMTAVALDAIFGAWRRAPGHPTADVTQAIETACRTLSAVKQLPLV